jgi:hypothetical protein
MMRVQTLSKCVTKMLHNIIGFRKNLHLCLFIDYFRQMKKRRGSTGKLPTCTKEVVEGGVPDVFRNTVGGDIFLR